MEISRGVAAGTKPNGMCRETRQRGEGAAVVTRKSATRCAFCASSLEQASRGRPRKYCSARCRKAAQRGRDAQWTWLEANDPQLATLEKMCAVEHAGETDPPTWGDDCKSLDELAPELKEWGIVPGGVPSPDDSTVDHVTATVLAACAVATELRRHGIAADGLLGPKCAAVASALDKALAAEFGDVLQS